MEITDKDIEIYLNLFQGHQNAFAKQWVNGKGYSPLRPERPIVLSDISLHISGRSTYGIYPIMQEDYVKLIVFDIDLPKKFSEVGEDTLLDNKENLIPIIKKVYSTIITILNSYSFYDKCIVIEDTGGRGYHIWLFFNLPISAKDARAFALLILKKADVQCEIFPKQDKITKEKYGNLIKLPLGIHKKYNRHSIFVEIINKKISEIKKPFDLLKKIDPLPISIISKILKEEYETTSKLKEKLTSEKSPEFLKTVIENIPETGNLFDNCKAFFNLRNKAISEKHLEHEERLALVYVLINTKDGKKFLHQILSYCSDYDKKRTQKEIDYLESRRMKPISCRRLIEKGICEKFCRSEILEQSTNPDSSEPSPIRFASWENVYEPESLWKPNILSFENIYTKYNLYRAWEQVKNYIKENEAIIDLYSYENFEEHLEENIETLRFELRNLIYKPQPYRFFYIRKNIKNKNFELRRMSFLQPRDYVVIQAIINIIGPTFEKNFSSNSCIGYRLDTKGVTGNSIFYTWQSAWHKRKERVTRFLFNPECFYYLKADILQFYDRINRLRLYDLILNEIRSEQEICDIIKSFLENKYIDDVEGNEILLNPPDKGIPQGPAFSAFFANIYLNDLDHQLEKKCFDYVRYIDDMVLLCRSKNELKQTKDLLSDYLNVIDLELNVDKTSDLIPVTQPEPLLDFLSEIKYEMAGLFSKEILDYQFHPQFLKHKLDGLLKIRKLNFYDLEDIAKHLSYYLKMREKIEIKMDDLAVKLSEKILTDYALKPSHLITVLEVLIKNNINLNELISKCDYPYLKIVFSILLTKINNIPSWAKLLLDEFIKDNSSYVLRGIAYKALLKLPETQFDIQDNVKKESSLFVLERSLEYISTIKDNVAKMHCLELLRTHFSSLMYEIINSTIKWNDSLLDRLIINWLENENKTNIPNFFIVLEFILLTSPEILEKIVINLLSIKESLLLRQLIIPSMSAVEQIISERNSSRFAFEISLYNAIKNIKSNWLKKIMFESIDEWKINEKDINHFLKTKEPNKHFTRISMLSSAEHLKQGGYHSWVVVDELSNKKMILEMIEENTLLEQNIINENITVEVIKDQLMQNNLSSIFYTFQRIEGGKKYHFFEYSIPDGFDILYNVLKDENKKFDEIEILKIISFLFNQVELIKQHTGIEPVINPHTIIIGEGNQVYLINIFYGTPRKLYISSDKKSIIDTSTSTNSFFNGLLMCELISKKCPVKIYKKLTIDINYNQRYFSSFMKDTNITLHFSWILDRLCSIKNPEYRYKNLNTLKKDIECYQEFANHFKRIDLTTLPVEIKYWAEVFNVLNLRIVRFLQLPQKQNDSISEKILETFDLSIYFLTEGIKNYANHFEKDSLREIYFRELNISPLKNLHEAGYKCALFANNILDQCNLIEGKTNWHINFKIPFLIIYISLELELLALAKNLGLFNMQDKEIKSIINEFTQSLLLPTNYSSNNRDYNRIKIELLKAISLLINRNIKDFMNINSSIISVLIKNILKYLNENNLWDQWRKNFSLRQRICIPKAIIYLEYLSEYILNIENIIIKFLNNPIQIIDEKDKEVLKLYYYSFQRIFKINKILKINRNKTYAIQDFYYSFQNKIDIKLNHKPYPATHDLLIPYPSISAPILQFERITVDYVKTNKKYYVKSISTIPTGLKLITQWDYKNIFLQFIYNLRKYYKNKIWQISAYTIFISGVILSLLQFKFPNTAIFGYILLSIGGVLISPVIVDYYTLYKSKK